MIRSGRELGRTSGRHDGRAGFRLGHWSLMTSFGRVVRTHAVGVFDGARRYLGQGLLRRVAQFALQVFRKGTQN